MEVVFFLSFGFVFVVVGGGAKALGGPLNAGCKSGISESFIVRESKVRREVCHARKLIGLVKREHHSQLVD